MQIVEVPDDAVTVALIICKSHIGLPSDVWAVVSTGSVTCFECGFIRTQAAHQAHLSDGPCVDSGPARGVSGSSCIV